MLYYILWDGYMRKLVAILCAVMMAVGLGVSASAAVLPDTMQPNYVNAAAVDELLTFNGTLAKCEASVTGMSGTTSITATIMLDKVNSNGTLSRVETWSGLSVKGSYLSFSDSRNCVRGNTYRLTVDTTVVRNGYSERIVTSVDKYCA